jgi:phosphoribosylamine--glycine ligase
MKTDLVEVAEACIDGRLEETELAFTEDACLCVVLASDGYPVRYEKGFPIRGLETFEGKTDEMVFHSGTKFGEHGEILTNGGRVLAVTALAPTLKEAREKAYRAAERVTFSNKYMRHDIGHAIDEV